jgi:hypothetical protein
MPKVRLGMPCLTACLPADLKCKIKWKLLQFVCIKKQEEQMNMKIEELKSVACSEGFTAHVCKFTK